VAIIAIASISAVLFSMSAESDSGSMDITGSVGSSSTSESALYQRQFSLQDAAGISSSKQRLRRLTSVDDVTWYGTGRVCNESFWRGMRGIGFSPADDRGEWFMKREDNPSMERLDDALKKVSENGYNMVRTWRTGSYEKLALQRIKELSLDIKVQLGVDIENDWHAEDLIDQAAEVAASYPDLVLGLSVGNERMHFGGLYAEQVRKHALYAKQTYNIPVTYNFVVKTITHSRRRSKAAKAFELCSELDYVNVHLYGGHYISGRYDGDWTPSKQVEAVKQQEREVMAKIGSLQKPIIVGESGWQSRMYKASSIYYLRNYYVLITRHIYSNDADSPAAAMFYFNLNDEAWKGGDDSWGLYDQGDYYRIGASGTGAPKFTPTSVTKILQTNPELPTIQNCASQNDWPDVRKSCGSCSALVAPAGSGSTCDIYCKSLSPPHSCAAAAEEVDNDCTVLYSASCDEEIQGTSDFLCTCSLS
jgi:hypothetical protein